MRVAAPIPNIALLLLQRCNQARQRQGIEAADHTDAAAAGQFDKQSRALARLRPCNRRRLHQFNRNECDLRGRCSNIWNHIRGTALAIVVQRCYRKAMLTAECLPRQTALFILHHQPRRLFPAPPTPHFMLLRFSHEPTTSQSNTQEKNGVARTRTLDQLRTGLLALQKPALPKSLAGQAANYTLSLWSKLTLFLDYPELELSNNLAENSMRPVAIGRRNWLHLGSKEAGPRVAAILSIVESCRRLKIPVRDY